MNHKIASPEFDISAGGLGVIDRVARIVVFSHLSRIGNGTLIVEDSLGRRVFGNTGDSAHTTSTITVTDERFYRLAALKGGLGVAESYMNDWWHSSDLPATFRLFVRRIGNESPVERTANWFFSLPAILGHKIRKNTRIGSRKNIRAHYDLGNELFQLFLDDTMTYSCGVFDDEDSTLMDASRAKYDRICKKLGLGPDVHVLEVGSGWGGFAIYAAQNYGCRVTTTTISKEQFELAGQRIDASGLSDRITILLKDYRDLTGQYDRVVSIEMIEAVGNDHLPTYFQKCASLLKPDGAMALQSITMPDQRYKQYLRSVDFIRQFVFPGSCCPSRTAILEAVTSASDLRLVHLEEIGPHYATTLRLWREAFISKLDQVRSLGYPGEFIRMWEFYLCYCEVGFAERHVGNAQIVLHKPRCKIAPILPILDVLQSSVAPD
ncbi:MAG: cyclopropane-fatty-acyl-phospholipid synthase family protein [Chthonomonadales bacterium]